MLHFVNLNEYSLLNMQLTGVKSNNESLSKCHDSPTRILPVQFSYYLLVFKRSRGQDICQLTVSPPGEFANFIFIAPGVGMGTRGIH